MTCFCGHHRDEHAHPGALGTPCTKCSCRRFLATGNPPSINAVDPSAGIQESRHRASEETDAEALTVLRQRLRDLRDQWQGMVKNANADGPIPGDEIGHPSRWTAVEMCADELTALLVDPLTPQEK